MGGAPIAAFVDLQKLLRRSAEVAANSCEPLRIDARWLRIASLLEAKSIGHPSVTEEVEWLFHGLKL